MIFRWLLVCCVVAGCSDHEPRKEPVAPMLPTDAPPASAEVAPRDAGPLDVATLHWYRVEARVTNRAKVPFLLGVDPVQPRAVIDAGAEHLALVVLQREPLVLRIPVRGTQLAFDAADAAGAMRGTWEAEYYLKRDFRLVATPIAAPRPDLLFPGTAPPSVDLSGTWRIDIEKFGVGRAIFRQDASGTLTGTIIPPEVGDLRHLLGRVIGSRAELSVFDGMHGYLISMTAKDRGKRLAGTWVIAGIGPISFTATREKAPETHLEVEARLAPGKTRMTLPELDLPPYKGNPVIVDYFGSWCPVCIDLTPELVRLHAQHAKAGLQVLSIALEPPGDEVETQKRLDEFRVLFGVSWPFTIRYTEDLAGAVPPEIIGVTGFPVTIFVRRDGTVAGVHTGFVSNAASAEHAVVVERFNTLAAEIAR